MEKRNGIDRLHFTHQYHGHYVYVERYFTRLWFPFHSDHRRDFFGFVVVVCGGALDHWWYIVGQTHEVKRSFFCCHCGGWQGRGNCWLTTPFLLFLLLLLLMMLMLLLLLMFVQSQRVVALPCPCNTWIGTETSLVQAASCDCIGLRFVAFWVHFY